MQLGITVKDKITGFTGIVTGFVVYLSGCNQALVAPPVAADGGFKESCWFDVQRLEQVGTSVIKLNNTETPGFDSAAPKR